MKVILFFCFLALSTWAQDTAGVGGVNGKVTSADNQPAANVKVCVSTTSRCATTAPDGSYRITEIRVGDYVLEIAPPGLPVFRSNKIEVRAGLEGTVDIQLPKVDALQQTVTVEESVFLQPEEIKSSGYIVQNEEIFKTAGALQDVSRYVQTLPGVVIGSDDFRNDIIVRGGSPLENLFIVDNIEIPNINAFANTTSAGGTVGLLDAALIRDATFLTGGYPSPYVNRTSGVLQIQQKEGDRDRFGGRATLGFAGSGVIFEGPIKKGKGSWITSVRRSFLDFFTDDVGFGGVPVLYTVNSKALYDLSPRDRIWAVTVSGRDSIRLGLAEGADLDEEIQNLDINYSGWRSANGFNWQRLFGERGVGLLGITHSEARVNQRVRDLFRNGVPNLSLPVADQIAASPEVYRERSGEGESTIKYDLTTYMGVNTKIQAGATYKIFNVTYNVASPFGEDTPFSLVRGVNPINVNRDLRAYQSGAYFQTTRDLGSRVNLTFGGRVDNYSAINSTRFSPRAGVNVKLTNRLSWRSSFGSYYQQPFFFFLAAFDINRGTIPFRADHYVSGFQYLVSPSLRISVEGYRKNYKDYPVSLQFPTLSLASIGDTFDVSSILFPLTSAGRGRVQGVELFIEKKFTDRWFGQANVSYSNVQQAGLDGIERPGSFDYRRVVNVVGGYRLTKNWELSTRIAWLGGRPYTPFNALESTRQRRPIFDLSQVNALRLPDYLRIDIRADRTFMVRNKPLLVFIGAQNIINRQNVSNFGWNRRLNAEQRNEQLGLFPAIGLEWRF
jgi:outer membrane receptor protein involved in Fe transport